MSGLGGTPDERLVELAQEARSSDTRPFEELVRRHQGFVVANCRFITRSPADAEDLAQEVFVKAFFALERFEARAQFRTWLSRVKVNHCLNYLRRRKQVTLVDVESGDVVADRALHVEPAAEAEIETASDRERIARVLDQMSHTLRIPLLLRDADGLSYEEIADQLGIGLSAVKMRIKRGREEFRRLFGSVAADASSPQG